MTNDNREPEGKPEPWMLAAARDIFEGTHVAGNYLPLEFAQIIAKHYAASHETEWEIRARLTDALQSNAALRTGTGCPYPNNSRRNQALAEAFWAGVKQIKGTIDEVLAQDGLTIIAKHSASSLSFRDGWDARGEADAKVLCPMCVVNVPRVNNGMDHWLHYVKPSDGTMFERCHAAPIRALEPPTEKKGKE